MLNVYLSFHWLLQAEEKIRLLRVVGTRHDYHIVGMVTVITLEQGLIIIVLACYCSPVLLL